MKKNFYFSLCFFFLLTAPPFAAAAQAPGEGNATGVMKIWKSEKAGIYLLAAGEASQMGLMDKAQALFDDKKYDEVIRLLFFPCQSQPDDFPLNSLLAKAQLEKCLILKQSGDKSYKTLVYEPYNIGQRLYKIDQTHPVPYYIVAKSLLINNRPQKAGKTVKKAIYFSRDDKEKAEYYALLGDAWSELLFKDPRAVSRAKDAYRTAISLGGGDAPFKARIEDKIKALTDRVNRNKEDEKEDFGT